MFAQTSVEFIASLVSVMNSISFIALMRRNDCCYYITISCSVRRKLQQWAQGCIYTHMHDVIEYRSNVCVCVLANKREKKKPLLLNVYTRGIIIRQPRRTFDIIDIHIESNYLLSSSFLYIWQFQSFIFDNHETYMIISK